MWDWECVRCTRVSITEGEVGGGGDVHGWEQGRDRSGNWVSGIGYRVSGEGAKWTGEGMSFLILHSR